MSGIFRRLFSGLIVFGLGTVLITSSVDAQRRVFKPTGGGIYAIALRSDVQKELGIDDDKTKARLHYLSDVVAEELKKLKAAAKGDPEQYSPSAIDNVREKHEDELKEILTAEQYERLQQIYWQMQGYLALTDPDLVDALKMTPEQVENIVAANREMAKRQGEYLSTRQKVPQKGEEIRRTIDGFVADRNKKIEEILTPAQMEKYVELQGKPFK